MGPPMRPTPIQPIFCLLAAIATLLIPRGRIRRSPSTRGTRLSSRSRRASTPVGWAKAHYVIFMRGKIAAPLPTLQLWLAEGPVGDPMEENQRRAAPDQHEDDAHQLEAGDQRRIESQQFAGEHHLGDAGGAPPE